MTLQFGDFARPSQVCVLAAMLSLMSCGAPVASDRRTGVAGSSQVKERAASDCATNSIDPDAARCGREEFALVAPGTTGAANNTPDQFVRITGPDATTRIDFSFPTAKDPTQAKTGGTQGGPQDIGYAPWSTPAAVLTLTNKSTTQDIVCTSSWSTGTPAVQQSVRIAANSGTGTINLNQTPANGTVIFTNDTSYNAAHGSKVAIDLVTCVFAPAAVPGPGPMPAPAPLPMDPPPMDPPPVAPAPITLPPNNPPPVAPVPMTP